MDLVFADESNDSHDKNRIDLVGFERDFAEECDPGSNPGYALLTNGMSNRRMNVPADVVVASYPCLPHNRTAACRMRSLVAALVCAETRIRVW